MRHIEEKQTGVLIFSLRSLGKFFRCVTVVATQYTLQRSPPGKLAKPNCHQLKRNMQRDGQVIGRLPK